MKTAKSRRAELIDRECAETSEVMDADVAIWKTRLKLLRRALRGEKPHEETTKPDGHRPLRLANDPLK